MKRLLLGAAAAASLIAASSQAPAAPLASLAVVELFTSQGCSSCPPANANFAALADRPDVLALSFGVTYWDYLGWKDTFAQPMFTQRQVDYETALGHSNAFTPQIVVNGRDDLVGTVKSELDVAVARSVRASTALLHVENGVLAVHAGAGGPANVWLVHYNPGTVQVPIARGENSGRTLPHRNVVRELVRLGVWNGTEETFPLPPTPQGLKSAVLLQQGRTGPILAAWKE
ncbi:MAG: DUF1223 domain-containing protein [Proteobacteria bacterium]|nr:DUF1223 domain-containing protein [Pseudomonadota bacterium]